MKSSLIADDAVRTWATRAAAVDQSKSNQDSSSLPWLVGDVGGTNARFAFVDGADGDLTDVRVLRCAGHRDLDGLVRAYLAQVGDRDVDLACIALAGPVIGDRCRTTNAEIEFSIGDTERSLGLRRLEIVNDFAAAALAAFALRAEHAVNIGTVEPVPGLPIAVVGPGTGLGVAALVPLPDGAPVVLPGEGGHVLVGPVGDLEWEIFRASRAENVPLTAEMLVSGPGLVRLHCLLSRVRGVQPEELAPEDVCARAIAGADETCEEALHTFCTFLGSLASNVALTTGARGGIYLAGGILPTIADFLARSGFRARFQANPEMAAYLSRIATVLMTDPFPGLRGAATALETGISRTRLAPTG